MNLQMMQILSPAAFLYIAYNREEAVDFSDERIQLEMEGCI